MHAGRTAPVRGAVSSTGFGEAYEPVVHEPNGGAGTLPHQLDREVAVALPALWYFLHLPRVFWELVDLPVAGIGRIAERRPAHTILLAPIEAFDPGLGPDFPGP